METKTSKYVGVRWDKRAYSGHGAWRASIGVNGHDIHIGYFLSEEIAHESYLIAKDIVKKWREGGCKEEFWDMRNEIGNAIEYLSNENFLRLHELQPERELTPYGQASVDRARKRRAQA